MIRLGLTGSIGMGKSVTAQMFRDEGIQVHDADQTVHELYAGPAAELIDQAFPGVLVDGKVDRQRLASRVIHHPEAMAKLEAIIHPLVQLKEEAFLKRAEQSGAILAVLDIPLLFETHAQTRVDKILVVTAPAETQRQRVLARPGMSPDKLKTILARQLPDPQKRAKADYVINTGLGLDRAREEVRKLIALLANKQSSHA
jgi:dephospho-CoA kinase